MFKGIKDYFTRTKCPRCKKYLNEQMQFKFDHYYYCDCDKCGLKIDSIMR